MLSDETRAQIVAAAFSGADDETDALAFVKIGDRLSPRVDRP
jgi:hypothetical protein